MLKPQGFDHHQGIRQAARPVAKVAMAAAERSKTFQELRLVVMSPGWIDKPWLGQGLGLMSR